MIFEKYNKECDKILDINIKFNNHKIIYSNNNKNEFESNYI